MWRPGTAAPSRTTTLTADALLKSSLPSSSDEFITLLPPAPSHNVLPIKPHRRQILHALETHKTLIIVGETGSGKSTQVSLGQAKLFVSATT